MKEWQQAWERVRSGAPVLAVGLISGTSADGVDAAAAIIEWRSGQPGLDLRAFRTTPYPQEVREGLFRCFAGAAGVREVCGLHARIGELFADAAEAVLRQVPAGDPPLALVASHGQTIWHEPDPVCRASLQIGEPARIAERLQVPVIADFRQQDLALGGEGAPLVPFFDFLLLADPGEHRAVQNLGGIGNVTYLRAGGAAGEVRAFDTGPANAWMDTAAALVSGGALDRDEDGRLAAAAEPDPALLRQLLAEPYFSQAPPKSTGRELFSAARVEDLWRAGHRGAVLVSTLTQLTVESIAEAYRRWLGPIDRVVLGGGGSRNPELVRRLRERLAPAVVTPVDELGIDSDAKEALAFALMGYYTLRGEPSNLPSATGARRTAVQGKICLP